MMRRSVKALSVILILVLAVNLTACSADNKTIVGTWKETGTDSIFNATLTLNKDGRAHHVYRHVQARHA